jgi:hypothetical protein
LLRPLAAAALFSTSGLAADGQRNTRQSVDCEE